MYLIGRSGIRRNSKTTNVISSYKGQETVESRDPRRPEGTVDIKQRRRKRRSGIAADQVQQADDNKEREYSVKFVRFHR